MAGRIVILGATGYTGRLVVAACLAAGQRPVLAGRDRTRLTALAEPHDLEVAVADVADHETVAALVTSGDVLVSTVGPFSRYGAAALHAATATGAHYVDSTGEGAFIRGVFSDHGPRAERAGCALLTAFGYDFVPGNLAGALAAREGGDDVRRIAVGYFLSGTAGPSGMSSGTRASMMDSGGAPAYLRAGGELRTVPAGREVRWFPVGANRRLALLVGASEPLVLPRSAPGVTDVAVYLGWFGAATRLIQLGSYLRPVLRRLRRPTNHAARAGRRPARTGEGPDAQARTRTGTLVVAQAFDSEGRELSRVTLRGPNPYQLTGALMAWAAGKLAAGDVTATGALGPVDAFGLDSLTTACADFGLRESRGGGPGSRLAADS